MKRETINSREGLTFIEVIVAISIVIILSVLSFQAFNVFIKRQALDKDAQQIASQIKEARSATLASRGDTSYGVHITATRTVMFKGTTFTESDTDNREFGLNSRVTATTSLNGGGVDILFDRLKGTTDQYGSITLSLVASTTITKTISIGETGIVEF